MRKLIALLSFIALSAGVLVQDSALIVTRTDLKDIGTAFLTTMDGTTFIITLPPLRQTIA